MLVHEQEDELHLLKAVPDGWLAEGQEIRLERLPTYFGEIGLTVRGTGRGVQVRLAKPAREAPRRIILHLPANLPLETGIEGVTVVARHPQSGGWDFSAVIEKYRVPRASTGGPAVEREGRSSRQALNSEARSFSGVAVNRPRKPFRSPVSRRRR